MKVIIELVYIFVYVYKWRENSIYKFSCAGSFLKSFQVAPEHGQDPYTVVEKTNWPNPIYRYKMAFF